MPISDTIKNEFSKEILEIKEHSNVRTYISLEPKDIPKAARFVFKDLDCRFVTASGIDTPDCIEILYHFSHDASGEMITLKAKLKDKKNPHIESLAPLMKGAEWIEREIWEMLGVQFDNHPNLKRLLLDEELPEDFHPLRKEKKEL
jgi:NADH:ubiquinone oxidoreductase subunit C